MKVRYLLLGCLGAASVAAAQITDSSPSTQAVTRERAAIIPHADHHQHLLGPTALPPLPVPPVLISIPPELQQLLDARASIAGGDGPRVDPETLYTEDAQAISWGNPTHWVRGRQAVSEAVATSFAPPFRFAANAYRIEGDLGFIAGSVTQGAAAQPVIDFLFAIRRGADGLWRIAAESMRPKTRARYPEPITAEKVVGDLDDAGIDRAVVLSVAYWLNAGRFPDPADEMTAEYAAVRAENDWVAEQVGRFPQRLVMACSVNILRAYAVQELERCSRFPAVRAFKLHFADADVDLRDAEHVRKVRRFFEEADRLRMPIIVHFAPRFSYGREYVELFLSQIMAAAPHILVQIAHLGGDGPGIDHPEGSAAFAEAIERRDPRARNLYFDFAGLVNPQMSEADGEAMAVLMRRIGLDRIFYGSDGQPPNRPTAEYWMHVRRKLPLTESELRLLAQNVAPYLRAASPPAR